jgi:hypothetical protein
VPGDKLMWIRDHKKEGCQWLNNSEVRRKAKEIEIPTSKGIFEAFPPSSNKKAAAAAATT